MFAILVVGARRDDLEPRTLQKLDQRGARIENQMLGELVADPAVTRNRTEETLRIRSDQSEVTARLQKIFDGAQCVVRVGKVFEDMKKRDGVKERSRIHESRQS